MCHLLKKKMGEGVYISSVTQMGSVESEKLHLYCTFDPLIYFGGTVIHCHAKML